MIELGPLSSAVPAELATKFEEQKAAIKGGSLLPFGGEVKDQDGAVKVATGADITDAELWGMKWYVDGVESKMP